MCARAPERAREGNGMDSIYSAYSVYSIYSSYSLYKKQTNLIISS